MRTKNLVSLIFFSGFLISIWLILWLISKIQSSNSISQLQSIIRDFRGPLAGMIMLTFIYLILLLKPKNHESNRYMLEVEYVNELKQLTYRRFYKVDTSGQVIDVYDFNIFLNQKNFGIIIFACILEILSLSVWFHNDLEDDIDKWIILGKVGFWLSLSWHIVHIIWYFFVVVLAKNIEKKPKITSGRSLESICISDISHKEISSSSLVHTPLLKL